MRCLHPTHTTHTHAPRCKQAAVPHALRPCLHTHTSLRLGAPQLTLAVPHARCVRVRGLFDNKEAGVSTAVSNADTPWYKLNEDLWVKVHDEEAFCAEINSSDRDFVAVEWFAPWCKGCEKSYPEICKVLKSSDDLRKSMKFLKVSVDELPKAMVKAQGVAALPRMSIYRSPKAAGKEPYSASNPPQPVVVLDTPFSKIKNLKQCLNTILANPSSGFAVDPNGFIKVTGDAPSQEQIDQAAAKRKAELAELEASSNGIFAQLKRAAGLSPPTGTPAAAAPASSPSAPAAAPPASNTQMNEGASSSSSPYLAPFVKQYGEAFTKARQEFLSRHSNEYGYDGKINELYPEEVGVRMKPLKDGQLQQHYLDYTGSSVYTNSQLNAIFEELSTNMFGNPHSANPSSSLSSDKVDEARRRIMKHFNADPTDWQVVFTRSATGALKMVGETFPWSKDSTFRYLRTNHNSVLGIREYAIEHGGSFQAVDESLVSDWLQAPPSSSPHDHHRQQSQTTSDSSSDASTSGTQGPAYSLFAFPAEDNFAGVKFPLEWASAIKRRNTEEHKWMVLVDAAAYAPTQPLDVSKLDGVHFIDIAFYKMFGYPTGLGALLVRTEAVPLLHKVFWGGGSVALATPTDNFHTMRCKPSDKLEDGTVSFLDIISLRHGFDYLDKLGGVQKVQGHTEALRAWTYEALSGLKHSNGAPIAQIYGKHDHPDHKQRQGPILNFTLLAPDGTSLSYKTFEREAADAGFHVRTGAECNPGACYSYLGVEEQEVEALAGEKEGCDDDIEFVKRSIPTNASQSIHSSEHLSALADSTIQLGHPAEIALKWVNVPLGSVRVSLGYMSTFEDVYALVDFIRATYTDRAK